MHAGKYTYLKFVKSKDIERWDIKSLSANSLSSYYSMVKLSSLLSSANIEWIDIEDDKTYPILGVHAHGEGVYINKEVLGKELTMKQYQKSKVNTLFYCKVRTVNGQWGVVFPEYANSYGSSNMQYLEINFDLINPYFLLNLLKIRKLTDIWDAKAIGADGRHFTLTTLLQLQIPLPSLSEQQTIIDSYNKRIKKAQELEEQTAQIEKEIEEYLLSELNISITKAKLHKGLNLIRFKDVDRWDIPFFFSSTRASSKYDTVKLATCLDKFMLDNKGQSLRTETYKYPTNTYHYIGMDSIEKSSGTLLDLPIVKGSDIKSQTISVPIRYFIYGKLRPYLNKYWINDRNETDIVCSSEFFVFSIKDSINKLFFKYLLSSSLVQSQLSDAVSGARMPRINESIFKNLLLPIPPRSIQDRIAEHINEQKEKTIHLKQQAEDLRKRALEEFEKEIFI